MVSRESKGPPGKEDTGRTPANELQLLQVLAVLTLLSSSIIITVFKISLDKMQVKCFIAFLKA